MKSLEQRQNELRSLLNEFKTMEQNRKDHDEESKEYIKKQQAKIEKIRKENEILKSEITSSSRSTTKTLTVTQQEILRDIHESGDKYAQAIANERELISDLEYEISQSHTKLLEKRKEMGGANAARENDALIQKQIRILETRLEKSLQKFNESIAQNKELRSSIDDLRKEQVVYENIYLKMERELQEKKEKMAELIESSNAAYEQRDAALLEISVIEQADRKEKADYDKQMNDMNNLLDNELKLPTYGVATITSGADNNNTMSKSSSIPLLKNSVSLGTTSKSRTSKKSTKNGILMIEDGNSIPPINSNKTTTNTTETLLLSKSTNDLRSGTANGSNTATNLSNTISFTQNPMQPVHHVQNFEEAFDRIKQATGINDVSDLVKTFIKNEQNNYSLFKYVNEQNAEISKIQEKIDVLTQEEDEWKAANSEADKNKSTAQQLEKSRYANENATEKYEVKNLELQSIFAVSLQYIKNVNDLLKVHDQMMKQKLIEENKSKPKEMGIFATSSSDESSDDHFEDKNNNSATVKRIDSIADLSHNDDEITELNFTSFIGQIEDKVINYMGQYNMFKDQIHQSTVGSNSLTNFGSSTENSVVGNTSLTGGSHMVFPDDDIADHIRNPPSPLINTGTRLSSSDKLLGGGLTTKSTSQMDPDDVLATQNDEASLKVLNRINTVNNKSIHPSVISVDTGEDHVTQVYYGTAVSDDRPMSKTEITNSAIHTVRQHSTNDGKQQKQKKNSSVKATK